MYEGTVVIEIAGEFINTSREAFRIAHDVSAYSLVALARAAVGVVQIGRAVDADTDPEAVFLEERRPLAVDQGREF